MPRLQTPTFVTEIELVVTSSDATTLRKWFNAARSNGPITKRIDTTTTRVSLLRILFILIAAGLSNYLTRTLFVLLPFESTELITTILETVVWCILWVTLAYTWIKWPWTAGMIICHLLVILLMPGDPKSVFLQSVYFFAIYLGVGVCWKLTTRPSI